MFEEKKENKGFLIMNDLFLRTRVESRTIKKIFEQNNLYLYPNKTFYTKFKVRVS